MARFRPLLAALVMALVLPATGACVANADPFLPLRSVLPASEQPSNAVLDLTRSILPGAERLDGVAFDPATGHLHVLSDQGLVEITRDGMVVDRILFKNRGLVDDRYRDVAVLPNGTLALARASDVMTYDAEEETLGVHFELAKPDGLEVVNAALGIDRVSGDILVAPEHLDYGAAALAFAAIDVRRVIARYDAAGTLQQENDVTAAEIYIEGIALDRIDDQLLVVGGSWLHRLTRDGFLIASIPLEGIQNGAGLTFGPDPNNIIVADRADMELRTFTIDR